VLNVTLTLTVTVKVGDIMAMRQRNGQSREESFTINVLPELSQRIKVAAEEKGLSAQEYIERTLEQAVPRQVVSPRRIRRGRINREAVEELMQFQAYLKEKYADQVFEDSAEVLRQLREERMRELENDR
jgi:hypothetical protein